MQNVISAIHSQQSAYYTGTGVDGHHKEGSPQGQMAQSGKLLDVQDKTPLCAAAFDKEN